jgi:hypothetical protein
MSRAFGVTPMVLALMVVGLPIHLSAQGNLPGVTPTAPSQSSGSTTSGTQAPASPTDSLKTAQGPKDSTAQQAAVQKSRVDSVQVVKHDFNHRQQIITGSVVMTCLALIMVTMNNYNPR